MARKNGNGGQLTAGQRLQALRDQMGALLKRKEELGSVLAQPDTADPDGWVKQAAPALGEQAAIDRLLPHLESEARAAEAQLAEQRQAETLEAYWAARAGLEPRLKAVLDALPALDAALAALIEQDRLCHALGGWAPQTGAGILFHALAQFRAYLRSENSDWRELMGLPRKLTREEQLLAAARQDLRSAEEMLARLKGQRPDYQPWDLSDVRDPTERRRLEREDSGRSRAFPVVEEAWKRNVKTWEEQVRIRRRRLADVERMVDGEAPEARLRRLIGDAQEAGARLVDVAVTGPDAERSVYDD